MSSGEPCDVKASRTVRRGDIGKVLVRTSNSLVSYPTHGSLPPPQLAWRINGDIAIRRCSSMGPSSPPGCGDSGRHGSRIHARARCSVSLPSTSREPVASWPTAVPMARSLRRRMQGRLPCRCWWRPRKKSPKSMPPKSTQHGKTSVRMSSSSRATVISQPGSHAARPVPRRRS